jgi:hypothetical protein
MKEKIDYDSCGKKRKQVLMSCDFCKKEFWKPFRFVKEGCNFCSKECSSNYKSLINTIEINCATCGQIKRITKSHSRNSKSGLYFCNRKCKEKAQRIGGIKEIQPLHYGNGHSEYRKKAIEHYGSFCELCGWKEYIQALEVHHIDKNRKNGDLTNLIVLCPNHHTILHLKLGLLVIEGSTRLLQSLGDGALPS